jgi:4-hydroxy-4-methyl-2-oxoglutarate aldolase
MNPGLLEAIRQHDTCTVANAIETFGVRPKNDGYTNREIQALFPALPPIAGYAVTAKVRSSDPQGGQGFEDRQDWWDFILKVPAPRVVVIEDESWEVGRGAIMGLLHATVLRALGVVSAVTNGSVRDLYDLEKAGFALFAGGTSVSHAYTHISEFGGPVTVGGLKIKPGDLVHADRHGVQTIPIELAAEIPARVQAMVEQEARVMEFCRSKEFNLEGLKQLMSSGEKV